MLQLQLKLLPAKPAPQYRRLPLGLLGVVPSQVQLADGVDRVLRFQRVEVRAPRWRLDGYVLLRGLVLELSAHLLDEDIGPGVNVRVGRKHELNHFAAASATAVLRRQKPLL